MGARSAGSEKAGPIWVDVKNQLSGIIPSNCPIESATPPEVPIPSMSDVVMPEIGGLDVLEHIKRAQPFTPVVMVTGYASVESAVAILRW